MGDAATFYGVVLQTQLEVLQTLKKHINSFEDHGSPRLATLTTLVKRHLNAMKSVPADDAADQLFTFIEKGEDDDQVTQVRVRVTLCFLFVLSQMMSAVAEWFHVRSTLSSW